MGNRRIVEKQKPKKSRHGKFRKIVEIFMVNDIVRKTVEFTGLPNLN